MDGCIHEIITITIDNPRWVERAKNAALLIIHTIFIPRQSDEPLKRYDPFSLRKISGEGQLALRKTCLGWDIQTCSLRVFLKQEEKIAWLHDIREYLSLTKRNTD